MSDSPLSTEVQSVLAELLRRPYLQLMNHVQAVCPDPSDAARLQLFVDTKKAIQDFLGKSVLRNRGEASDVSPYLVERLSFMWKILKSADDLIRSPSVALSAMPGSADLSKLLAPLLPCEMHRVLLESLSNMLNLGSNALYLRQYREFLKSNKLTAIDLRLVHATEEYNWENIERLTWWILRRRKEKFVNCRQDGSIEFEFSYLVSTIRDDIRVRYGQRLAGVPQLQEHIEDTIDKWLSLSCLEGECQPQNRDVLDDLAKAFVRHNRLDKTLVTQDPIVDPAKEKRIRELEDEVARYADENRHLEEKVAKLTTSHTANVKSASVVDLHVPQSAGDLRDFLGVIDSKYSFDILHGIQLGDESQVSLKNFLKHLFYALRKKGLELYPAVDNFHISYEESGLYQCVDFEIGFGEKKAVSVVARGWALKAADRLLPIRKAKVRLAT